MRLLAAWLVGTAAAYAPSRHLGRAHRSALRASDGGDDGDAAPEVEGDFRDFRARLIARSAGDGLTEASDERAVSDGWAYETTLLESGCVLLGGTRQEFGFGLRQQYFHKCVLLLTQYDDDFTRGVIVNRPSRREVDGWRLWCGGDVEEGGVFAADRAGDAPGGPRPPAIECLRTTALDDAYESAREVGASLWTYSFADAKRAVRDGAAVKARVHRFHRFER